MTPSDLIAHASALADVATAKLKADDPEALKQSCLDEMGVLILAAGMVAERAFPKYADAKGLYVRALKSHLARIGKPARASKNR